MAGIGLYGVYYSKATLTDGVLTGYNGVQTMGKAISASFEPAEANDNPLYANNGIAERDAAGGAGGTLNVTLDQLSMDAAADLFGLTKRTETVSSVEGTGFDFSGDELSAPVGVAFVRWNQVNNTRNHYQAVIFSYVMFSPNSEEYQTLGESVEWQTPELTGTVSGGAVTGAKPWKRVYEFPDQDSAIAFITGYFAA
jgi:phi13 family phage major tail protein